MTQEAIAEQTLEATPEAPQVEAVDGQILVAPADLPVEPSQEIAADAPLDVAEDVVTLDSLLERHPELRTDYEERLKVRENAAAQRRESQMRREAGTRENTRAQVKRYLDTVIAPLGVDTEEVGRDTRALDFMYALATENSSRELAEALPAALLAGYELTSEQKLAAVEARDELVTLADGSRVPNYDAYVRKLVDAATANRQGALKLADVPQSAPLHREIREMAARIAASELKAQRIESGAKVNAPPTAPSGGLAGASGPSIASMSDADAAFSEGKIQLTEYKKFREQFGLSFAPGGR